MPTPLPLAQVVPVPYFKTPGFFSSRLKFILKCNRLNLQLSPVGYYRNTFLILPIRIVVDCAYLNRKSIHHIVCNGNGDLFCISRYVLDISPCILTFPVNINSEGYIV